MSVQTVRLVSASEQIYAITHLFAHSHHMVLRSLFDLNVCPCTQGHIDFYSSLYVTQLTCYIKFFVIITLLLDLFSETAAIVTFGIVATITSTPYELGLHSFTLLDYHFMYCTVLFYYYYFFPYHHHHHHHHRHRN